MRISALVSEAYISLIHAEYNVMRSHLMRRENDDDTHEEKWKRHVRTVDANIEARELQNSPNTFRFHT